VSVTHGDTLICPYGLGSYSSRFAVVLAPAIVAAAKQIRDKLLLASEHYLGEKVQNLEIKEGRVISRKTEKSLEIEKVARLLYTSSSMPPGMSPGLETIVTYTGFNPSNADQIASRDNLYLTYPYAAAAIVVSVDKETGKITPVKYCIVHDCGTIINEAIVEGQIVGGLVQGIGGALLEELVYNEDGNLMSSTFMDYLIPTSIEASFELKTGKTVTPSPIVPGGFKGTGEAGILCSPPALVAAVENALGGGARITGMPMKPERIWKQIRAAGGNAADSIQT